MRRSRFTEEQIIAILAEQERGMKTAEVCRSHGAQVNPAPPRGLVCRRRNAGVGPFPARPRLYRSTPKRSGTDVHTSLPPLLPAKKVSALQSGGKATVGLNPCSQEAFTFDD